MLGCADLLFEWPDHCGTKPGAESDCKLGVILPKELLIGGCNLSPLAKSQPADAAEFTYSVNEF